MARGSVNKVTLLGNLGGDPEMRYMTNGDTVTSLNLATTEGWRDKVSQDKKEQTEWHRVVVYGKLAEIVSKYAKKGSQLYVEGRLRTRRWLDSQNQNRAITEIIASEIHVLSNRASGEDWVDTEAVASDEEALNNIHPSTLDDSEFASQQAYSSQAANYGFGSTLNTY